MTFADLVAGDAVFVDANILTYHFQPHPVWGPACSNLLRRIKNGELAGSTSTHVLSDMVRSRTQPTPIVTQPTTDDQWQPSRIQKPRLAQWRLLLPPPQPVVSGRRRNVRSGRARNTCKKRQRPPRALHDRGPPDRLVEHRSLRHQSGGEHDFVAASPAVYF